jgi:hypothetical protein
MLHNKRANVQHSIATEETTVDDETVVRELSTGIFICPKLLPRTERINNTL